MLPKDEYLPVSISAVNDGKNVYLIVNEKESDGALISQSLVYLTSQPVENEIVTRSSDCENVLISYTVQTITTYGDGYYRIINDVNSYLRLKCSGGEVWVFMYHPPQPMPVLCRATLLHLILLLPEHPVEATQMATPEEATVRVGVTILEEVVVQEMQVMWVWRILRWGWWGKQ